MTIVTKYDLGDFLYHVVSGEGGMVVGITITHGMATEYRLSLGLGEFRWAAEQELTPEKVNVI